MFIKPAPVKVKLVTVNGAARVNEPVLVIPIVARVEGDLVPIGIAAVVPV